MNKIEECIGKNIREVRLERGLSQEALAERCEFSNTTLSAYENNRKIPNLTTIARIAKQLNVSIERLYYGDENNSFIESEADDGRKIVNSIYLLWDLGVISYYEQFGMGMVWNEYVQAGNPNGMFLMLNEYSIAIKRFINSLNEFQQNSDTYPEPDKYLEMLKASVAKEINNMIDRKQNKQSKHQINMK